MSRNSNNGKINDGEKSLALNLETLYSNKKMYAHLNDFDVFFGEGSYDATVINLLLKQINKKRIELSSTPEIGISVFNTPRYNILVEGLTTFFSTNLSTNREKVRDDTYSSKILEVPIAYTLQMQEIIRLLSPFGIDIDGSEFVRQPEMENEILLSPQGKEIRLTFKSYDQTIPITLFLTKSTINIDISVINGKIDNTNYPTLSLTLTPQNAKTYHFNAELRKLHLSPKQPPEWTLSGKFEFTNKKTDSITINIDALMEIKSLALADDQKLNIAIKGSETLQITGTENLTFTEPTQTILLNNVFN